MTWPDLVAGMDVQLVARFGVPTTYDPAGASPPVTVRGIFDAAYVRAEVGEAAVSSAEPMVFYRLADLPVDPAVAAPVITVDGVVYVVIDVQKDSQGGVRLLLHKQ